MGGAVAARKDRRWSPLARTERRPSYQDGISELQALFDGRPVCEVVTVGAGSD